MKTLYTTSLPVSQRIKELIGIQEEGRFYWSYSNFGGHITYYLQYFTEIDGGYDMEDTDDYNAFTLSELPEVLKKVGEKLGWRDYKYHCTDNRELWLYHYLKCCELHALGQSVDNYLMELLK